MSSIDDAKNQEVLAALWSTIRRDLGISKAQVGIFVDLYLGRRRMCGEEERGYDKGNMVRSLGDTKMTIKVLMQALAVIGVVDGQIEVVLRFPNGYVTRHRQAFVTKRTLDVGTVPHITPANPSVVIRKPPKPDSSTVLPTDVEYELVELD